MLLCMINKPVFKLPTEHNSSGINYDELWEYFPEFFDHCSEVLKSNTKESFKSFINSVLEYLEDYDFITWAQFKSVLKIHKSYEDHIKHKHSDSLNKYNFSSGTMYFDKQNSICGTRTNNFKGHSQKDLDDFHRKIFGEPRFYECEEEGMVLSYDKKGSRIFLLPID